MTRDERKEEIMKILCHSYYKFKFLECCAQNIKNELVYSFINCHYDHINIDRYYIDNLNKDMKDAFEESQETLAELMKYEVKSDAKQTVA